MNLKFLKNNKTVIKKGKILELYLQKNYHGEVAYQHLNTV